MDAKFKYFLLESCASLAVGFIIGACGEEAKALRLKKHEKVQAKFDKKETEN